MSDKKLEKVLEANKQLTAEIERLECFIKHIMNHSTDDDTVGACIAALEVKNDR